MGTQPGQGQVKIDPENLGSENLDWWPLKITEKLIWLQSQSHESECHSQDSTVLMAVGGYVRGAVQGYKDGGGQPGVSEW